VLACGIAAIVLSACNFQPPAQPTLLPTASSSPLPSVAPTPTRTPGPPVAVLVLPTDADPAEASQAQTTISTLAQSSGLLLDSGSSLDPAALSPDVSLILLLRKSSQGELQAVSASLPTAHIVALADPGLERVPNLTLLQAPEDVQLQQAFLAGYTAALITDDYRVAALFSGADNQEAALADAFQNGAEYFCGLCRPARPPFEAYPLAVPYSRESGPPSAALAGTGVQTVFVSPSLADSQTLADLANAGNTLLGTQPAPPTLAASWAASFLPSALDALDSNWSAILGAEPPQTVTMPVTVQDVNGDLLSPGRLRLVIQTQIDLAQGLIDVTSAP
jgi:hypothetical protein